MIENIGVGIDMVNIKRIENDVMRLGKEFLKRVLSENEMKYCESKNNEIIHFAGKIAAKEAFVKSLSIGNDKFLYPCFEILNDENGKPTYHIIKNKDKYGLEKMVASGEISISHTNEFAIAIVIIEKRMDKIESL